MKNDDKLLESRIDEDEDLFDLSLDDLEPEDTIVEPHIEEPDDEIIELIDLVQRGDIDLGEEVKEPGDTLVSELQEPAAESVDELQVVETLDLLDIPLDEEISFDEFDEERQETGESITGDDLKFFIEGDQPEEIVETPIELFGEMPAESVSEESLIDKTEALEEFPEIEGALIVGAAETPAEQLLRESEKTMRIFPVEETAPESLHDMTIEELEQLPGVASEVIQKEQEAVLQQLTSEDEEHSLPPTETSAGVSEEKIEAIVRKVVEEAVPRITEEKIADAVEKIIAGTKKEVTPPVTEMPVGLSEEKIEAILRKIVEDVLEKVARETMTNVAEKIITDAINALQKSIESASE